MSEITLAAKLAQASIRVGGALEADKRNNEQNYAYISADKILAVAGQALAASGVVVVPSIEHEETALLEYENKYGKKVTRFDALVSMSFVITDGAQTQNASWRGRGSDYSTPDKALYKAITSGHKYFVAKLLNIGAGNEDGEHEQQEQDAPRPAPRVNIPQPVQPVQPEQPKNGNGNGDIRARYSALREKAAAIGIKAEPVEVFETDAALKAAGNALLALYEARKNGGAE